MTNTIFYNIYRDDSSASSSRNEQNSETSEEEDRRVAHVETTSLYSAVSKAFLACAGPATDPNDDNSSITGISDNSPSRMREPSLPKGQCRIMLGAARGLAFLHSSEIQIICRDFKTSNILLDGNYNAKLSDFGLAIHAPTDDALHVTTRVMGTGGYTWMKLLHLSVKRDVYQFGVVLLEMLTGKRAVGTNRIYVDEVDFEENWMKPYLSDRRHLSRVMDQQLANQYASEAAIQATELTRKCLEPDLTFRPSMNEVVKCLERIQAIESTSKEPQSGTNADSTSDCSEAAELLKDKEKKMKERENTGQSKLTTKTSLSSGPSTSAVSSFGGKSASGILPTPRSVGDILSSPNLKPFSFNELRNATRNFRPDSFLGEGGFGYVYKGWLDEQTLTAAKSGSGMVIAVKKLKPEGFQGHKEWLTEVNYLGQLHHPNLVKLIGYCLDGENRLLVYEFMPKGSLENHLFRRGVQSLPWEIRIKAAIGAARGLFFLHDAQVIYRDVKASNILLDSEFNAKLSDFGLAKAGPTGDRTQVMGTQGYAAPEYVATGRLSARSDVYSYGVVLLELLSGRRAVDKSKVGLEQNLVDWAKPYLGDKRKVFRIMDSKLEGQYPHKGAYLAANLALLCISNEAKSRPLMSEVLEALEQLQAPKNASSKHSHPEQRKTSYPIRKSPMRNHPSPLHLTPGGGGSPLLSHRRSPRVRQKDS